MAFPVAACGMKSASTWSLHHAVPPMEILLVSALPQLRLAPRQASDNHALRAANHPGPHHLGLRHADSECSDHGVGERGRHRSGPIGRHAGRTAEHFSRRLEVLIGAGVAALLPSKGRLGA